MPIGLITDVASLLAGGLLGGAVGRRFSGSVKTALSDTFGFCAIAIGVRLIVKMHTLSAVILAVVMGTLLGEVLRLEDRVNNGVTALAARFFKDRGRADDGYVNTFCAVAVIFCCSGTGWYGVLNEGFTGDGSILITKAILDFFTAILFAAVLGKLVSFLAVPQLFIYAALFSVSRLVVPFVTPELLADFSAVGGVVELVTGMRIAGIKRETRVINMIPAMMLIFPVSALWALFTGT